MFDDLFERLTKAFPEIRYLGVWGRDGLELTRYEVSGGVSPEIELLGAEMGDMANRLEQSHLDDQSSRLSGRWRGMLVLHTPVNRDYFLLVAADPRLLEGKFRFVMERVRPDLIKRF